MASLRKIVLGVLRRLGLAVTDVSLSLGHPRRRGSGPTEFVWSLGYPLLCDVSPFPGRHPPDYSSQLAAVEPSRYCRGIRDGDVVWLPAGRVRTFVSKVMPETRKRFSLVITDGDEAFPSAHSGQVDMGGFITDRRILSVFAQNLDGSCRSAKVFHLPIGLDFHTINHFGGSWGERQQDAQEQESVLKEIIAGLRPTNQRIPKAFVDFHLSDRVIYDGSLRSDVFRAVDDPGIIDAATQPLPRTRLWREKGKYAFSISPHGNGLDCHRTWEDLALGCIVIVKTSALDPVYEGLPVVIVKDWNEINPQALASWLSRFGDALADSHARERLTLAWWMERIRDETRKALLASAP